MHALSPNSGWYASPHGFFSLTEFDSSMRCNSHGELHPSGEKSCMIQQPSTTQPRMNIGHEHQEHTEGIVARTIEQQTAKLPSDVFLWAAGGSILGSLVLKTMGRNEDALFVGQWAPTFLILGLYNKIVKVAGHDEQS
jgi:hypothetical protein